MVVVFVTELNGRDSVEFSNYLYNFLRIWIIKMIGYVFAISHMAIFVQHALLMSLIKVDFPTDI